MSESGQASPKAGRLLLKWTVSSPKQTINMKGKHMQPSQQGTTGSFTIFEWWNQLVCRMPLFCTFFSNTLRISTKTPEPLEVTIVTWSSWTSLFTLSLEGFLRAVSSGQAHGRRRPWLSATCERPRFAGLSSLGLAERANWRTDQSNGWGKNDEKRKIGSRKRLLAPLFSMKERFTSAVTSFLSFSCSSRCTWKTRRRRFS